MLLLPPGGMYAGAGRYIANSAGIVHMAKREAEAEADPYVVGYGGYAGFGGHYGHHVATTPVVTSPVVSTHHVANPVVTAAAPVVATPHVATAPVVTGHHVATAPVVAAHHVATSPVVATPHVASHHVAPAVTAHHVAPVVATPHVAAHHVTPVAHHVASGYSQVSPSASLTTTGTAPAAVPAVGGMYAGAGRYVANSAGVVHVAKREAEADPYVVGYGGYAGFGGYHGMGYSAAHHVAT